MPAYPSNFIFRTPSGFSEALSEAARRKRTSASEILRRAAFQAINEAGVRLPPVPPYSSRPRAS